MRRLLSIFTAIYFLAISNNIALSQTIAINEVMSSNALTIADEDGDFEDWIELYNYGAVSVSLLGYGLSDNYGSPFKWVFPNVTIEAGEYMIIWTSGKNRIIPGFPLHTNFSISAAGEEIIITEPGGELVDEMLPIIIPTDYSYGKYPNGTGNWKYFTSPTPGSENIGPGYEFLIPPPIISHQEGAYTSAFNLNIVTPIVGASIYYTLDGSVPDENSSLYTSAINISSKVGVPNDISMIPTNNISETGPPYYEGWQPPLGEVFKINTVRVRIFHPEAPPSKVFSYSYLVDPLGNNRYSLPYFSITTDRDNFFDDEIGIYVHGNYVNYFQDGDLWERPVNITLFEKDGIKAFNEDVGIRLHGNTTKSRPRKSLRVSSRSEYGSSWINYQLFPDKDVNMFKRFILRNSGNDWDWAIFRDAFIQYLAKDLNVETQYYKPAIVFINGEYWGIHNIRDRYDDNYLFAKYGIEEFDMTIMENNSEFKDGNPDGASHYTNMLDFIGNNSMTNQANYEVVKTMMDDESFIDFQLTHIFAMNTDWPGNNTLYWRYYRDTYDPTAPAEKDGRWRWMILDTDFGFGLPFFYVPGVDEGPAHNTLAFALATNGPSWPNPAWSTFLLRRLISNTEFKNKFIIRYCDLLNTTFSAEHVISVIDSISTLLDPEMQEHINRWRRPTSMNEWLLNVYFLKEFAEQRTNYQFNHLQQQFALFDEAYVTLDVSNELYGYVKINTIDIKHQTMGVIKHPYPWTGKYYKGLTMNIEAVPYPGYQFSHWEGASTSTDPLISINLSTNIELKAVFTKTDDLQLIYFWFFGNNIVNDTPLEKINAHYGLYGGARIDYQSALEGYPFYSGHPSWRKASMERRNSSTNINYRPEGNNGIPFESVTMRAIQIKQPFTGNGGENTMIFSLPTNGFKDIIFRFAAKNEGAADKLIIDYSTASESPYWTSAGFSTTEYDLLADYQLFEIDFAGIENVRNNPNFKIRIRFDGEDMSADAGSRVTFNNFSLDGVSITAYNIYASSGGWSGSIFPSGNIGVYEGDNMTFMMVADGGSFIGNVLVDGSYANDDVEFENEGAIGYYTFYEVNNNHSIYVEFFHNDDNNVEPIHEKPEILIYPNPAKESVWIKSGIEISKIEIWNITGGLAYLKEANGKEAHISISELQSGLYIVRIYTNSGVYSKKIVKLK
ncbi:MAG: CotH kinase family protein [Bacteroidetes bacterium]|nr:CotH kinase family protein [Bacteroidota bacterium]